MIRLNYFTAEICGKTQSASIFPKKPASLVYLTKTVTLPDSERWSYSLSLLITGRRPPQVCKYSALKPSKENKRVGGVSNLDNEKEKKKKNNV